MASTSRNASRRGNRGNTQSQPAPAHTAVDGQVVAMINFILCHSANKIPIKFTEMSALADGRLEVLKRMPLVTKLLEETYGIKLIQLEGSPKRYICIAEDSISSTHELTASQRSQNTMLYIVLSYIFLRGNRVEDDKLYAMLEMLNIDVTEEHGYFGESVCSMISDTFVHQQYLTKERSQLSPYDDPKTCFSWGPRAKVEITFGQIVQFASKLFNQDPSFFEQQRLMAEGLDSSEIVQQLAADDQNTLDIAMDVE